MGGSFPDPLVGGYDRSVDSIHVNKQMSPRIVASPAEAYRPAKAGWSRARLATWKAIFSKATISVICVLNSSLQSASKLDNRLDISHLRSSILHGAPYVDRFHDRDEPTMAWSSSHHSTSEQGGERVSSHELTVPDTEYISAAPDFQSSTNLTFAWQVPEIMECWWGHPESQ